MKNPGMLIAAVAALTFANCHKPVAEDDNRPPILKAPPPPAKPVPVARATPVPIATPQPRELAPDGVFYLRVKKSITTNDGITAFPAGTLVRRTFGGEYLTLDGQVLKLDAREMTNDLAEARQIAGYTTSARAAQARAIATASATPASTASAPSTARANPQHATGANPDPAGSAPGRRYVPGVIRQASGMESSTSLGGNHTPTKDGWLWQRNAAGDWVRVKQLRK